MLCLHCAAARSTDVFCDACGHELVPLSQAALDDLIARRVARLLEHSERAGLIDEQTRLGIGRLATSEAPPVEEAVPVIVATAVIAASLEPPPLPPRRSSPQPAPVADGALLIETPGVENSSEGLKALALLDEPKSPGLAARAWPIFSENVGWVIGALLVLAGSIYGVREAWNALGDIARHAVVAGALLAYHAGFVGAGAALSRASASAGRVLATIGAGLLPMAFAVLASLVVSSPGIGLVAGAVTLLAVTPTLSSVARRWSLSDERLVSKALWPALAAQLLAQLPALGDAGALLPFAGLAGVWVATRPVGGALVSLPVVGFSLYGYAALEIASATRDSLDFSAGSLPLALLVLRAVLLSTRLHHVAIQEPERAARPALVTVEVALLAVLATACVAATGHVWSDDAVFGSATAGALAITLAAFGFQRSARHHLAALHFVVPLTTLAGSLLVAELLPHRPDAWPTGAALTACAWLWWANRGLETAGIPMRWASGSATFAIAVAWGLSQGGDPWWGVLATAAPVAVGWTIAGRTRSSRHYLAGLALIACVAAWRVPVSPASGWFETALLSGLVLLVADLLWQRLSSKDPMRPWADLSLVALLAAPALLFVVRDESTPMRAALALLAAGALLGLRGLLDRSTLVAVPGFTLVGLAVVTALSPASSAERALLLGTTTLAFILLGSIRRGPLFPWESRRIFGAVKLPWAAPPLRLAQMALGTSGLLLGLVAVSDWGGWLMNRGAADRVSATLAMALLAASALAAFLLRGAETLRARGNAVTLGLMGVFLALAAVTHRIDRPRTLEDAAWRATLVGVAVWLVAVGLQRYGKPLAERLGRPSHARFYPALAHLAVVLIGMRVLAKATGSLGLATTPPLALAGPALLALLIAWSLKSTVALHATHALALPAAMLIAVRGLSGSDYDLLPQALPGAALATLAFAAFAWWTNRSPDGQRSTSAVWTLVGAVFLFVCAFHFASPLPALLVLLSGALVAFTASRRLGLMTASLGAILVWHALANLSPVIPLWAGPAAAACALAVVGPLTRPSSIRLTSLVSTWLLAEGAVYALGAGRASNPLYATPNALEQAARGLSGSALGTWSMIGVLLAAALVQGRVAWVRARGERPAGVTRALGQSAAASGAATLALCLLFTDGKDSLVWSVPALALVGAGWHLLTLRHVEGHEPLERGLRLGRDLVLVASAVMTALVAAAPGQIDRMQLALVLTGLLAAALVAAHAVWSERRTRHVYGIQLVAVSAYAFARTELGLDLPPEVDATVVLALGFVLLGVTIVARRLDVPPVATATRRFATLLPLAVAWVMPADATGEAAALSAASGALWASLAWAGQSRWLGSLGAAAMNFALLVFALASGLDGAEIYLAPLGLLLLALGQIFASSLNDGARLTVRVLGALALYLPSAIQVALQVGHASDGLYPVLFGAACLLGVGIGILFRIRAYLALGTGFLALDVVASLFHAGRRDHRVAVLVLSLSGLAVLGLMIYVTLKREKVQRLREALKVQLSGWD